MTIVIGYEQTWQHNGSGAPSITLDSCAFNPDGGSGFLGYSRTIMSSTAPQMDYNAAGRAIFRSYRQAVRYSFSWSLLLTEQQWPDLLGLISAQNLAIGTQVGSDWPYIKIADKRLSMTDKLAPSRANAGIIGSAAGNSVVYWPVFDAVVQIKSSEQPKLYMDGQWLIEVELSGEEAEISTIGL